MNSEKFLAVVESNLTPMAPEFIPGLIKKQLDNLELSYKSMTPGSARTFITNVSEALEMFIGPSGSINARRFMMKKLRECCDDSEISMLMEIR
jgi:hypothetical protein